MIVVEIKHQRVSRPLAGAPLRALVMLIGVLAALVVQGPSVSAALPSQVPDPTWMVNGPVRSLERTGSTIWIGGRFTELRSSTLGGAVIDVNGLAAVDATTGEPVPGLHLPTLGGSPAFVYDMDLGGGVLYAAGKFTSADDAARSNLVAIDPQTGSVLPFDAKAPIARAVLADPDGGVYVGKRDVRRYAAGGQRDRSFTIQVPTVDPGSANGPAILDLAFAPNGDVIVGGAFDFLNDEPHRAIARLDPLSGTASDWALGGFIGVNARAIDLFVDGSSDALLAAVGGSDFAARYRMMNGELVWKVDTSGASQAITRYDDDYVIVGGHFRWVASQPGMKCGSNKHPTGKCERRARLAALDADTGSLDPTWAPDVKPLYFGVWSVLVRKGMLHVGGEFLEIEDVAQHYYARLPVTGAFSRS